MSWLLQMLALADVLSDTVFLPGSGRRRRPGFCGCWLKVPLRHHFSPSVSLSHCHRLNLNFLFCCFERTGYCLVRFFLRSSLMSTGQYFASFHYTVHYVAYICPGGWFLLNCWPVVVACHIIYYGWLAKIKCLLMPIDLELVLRGSLYLPDIHSCLCQITLLPVNFFGFIAHQQCKLSSSVVNFDNMSCPL